MKAPYEHDFGGDFVGTVTINGDPFEVWHREGENHDILLTNRCHNDSIVEYPFRSSYFKDTGKNVRWKTEALAMIENHEDPSVSPNARM